jgi:hypothetical protein
MWKKATFIACALLAAASAAQAQPADGAADDDLAVVKRAVEREEAAPAPQPKVHRTEKAHWFRVRIEDRDGSHVKVNLPLALVRELEDDVRADVHFCAHWKRGCKMRLAEVLDLLDSGQDLVEIKDADATVRIWVD